MSKIITICLDDNKYELFQKFALMDNREISNFMETATTRYIEEISYVDEFEMIEINSNQELNDSLNNARNDIKNNRRRIVD
ncbi:MAG: CopG family transcriptional regulator [Cyanobacteria bacterium]|nr:CopG family transcriptional regulator [Cyanobacteria bacterium CG_2015-16_32_12]NCO78768.1 CopG family transcriptional regulator [Cyanobacteria bacterium CG_2015-22_32_23]NCQ05263.1 CopG family transcriptional regulator [Cyanobacteria bacterium CG_2015-09_32_10]NCQ42082.1 CopG family transcriptional regulator [Cyanobacteria bacterium CG_2015-04_32_10]